MLKINGKSIFEIGVSFVKVGCIVLDDFHVYIDIININIYYVLLYSEKVRKFSEEKESYKFYRIC